MATSSPTTLSFGGNPATGEAPTTYNVNSGSATNTGSGSNNLVGAQVTSSPTTSSSAPIGLNYNAGVAANTANPPTYGEQGQLTNGPTATPNNTQGNNEPAASAAPAATTPNTPAQTPTTTSAAPAPITTPQAALAAAQASGVAPQTSAEGSAAVSQFQPQEPTFYKPTTAVPGYDPSTVFNDQGQPLSYQQYLAAGGKADFSNVTAGSPPSQSSSTPAQSTANTPANVAQALAQDPGYQAILAAAQNAQNTATQGETLESQYTDLMNQYNIPQINSELVNDQAIINGTETDIENEVKASGGFATESQVSALAAARNKTLIAQYNTLQATKTDAMNTINTMIGLAGQDRQFAQTAANNQLQITEQEADYQQKFIANQQADYNAVISTVGYAGLYQSLNATGGANSVALAEQVMGLTPGELSQIAATPSLAVQKSAVDLQLAQTQLAQAKTNLTQSNAEEPLKVQQLQSQINSSNASAANSEATTAKTRAETDFENANNGMTPTEEATQVQAFTSKAADYITQLATGKITWSAAWNALHTAYPEASTKTLDDSLDATNYRNSTTGG